MAALQTETKMSNWNDDRLDKRDEEVKEGFVRLEVQMKGLEQRMEGQVKGLEQRLEGQMMGLERKLEGRMLGLERKLEGQTERLEQKIEGQVKGLEHKMEGQMERLEGCMNEGFAEMRSAYAGLTRTLLVGAIAIVVTLIGVVGAS